MLYADPSGQFVPLGCSWPYQWRIDPATGVKKCSLIPELAGLPFLGQALATSPQPQGEVIDSVPGILIVVGLYCATVLGQQLLPKYDPNKLDQGPFGPPKIDASPTPNPKFYYSVRAYDSSADFEQGYNALRQSMINSGLPGGSQLANQLQGQWNKYQQGSGGAYPFYVGFAFQSQRTKYYNDKGLATAASGRAGIPDIAVNWVTGGNPPKIEAVETKARPNNSSGTGYWNSLTRTKDTVLTQSERYQAQYPGRWLLEVNKLDASEEVLLRSNGGVPFDTNLYK